MHLKRQITIPIIFFLLLIVIGAGLIFLTSYLLPGYLESKIISIFKKDAATADFTLEVQELGLKGANLGSMRIGTAENPALVVRSIHVDYSPQGIYQKKIKRIAASGVELYCEYKNGRLGLRGFDLTKFLAGLQSDTQKDKTAADPSSLSFPQRIEINNGMLIGITRDGEYRIPFEIDMVSANGTVNALHIDARLYPRGQKLKISAQMDLEQNRIVSHIAAKEMDLLRFSDIVNSIDALRLAGFASLEANAELQLAPFKVSSITGRLKGSAIDIRYKNLLFRNRSSGPGNQKPLIMDFKGPERGNWNLTLSALSAVEPVSANLADMAATIEPAEAGYRVSGNFKLSFNSSSDLSAVSVPLKFAAPFDLPLELSAIFVPNSQWRLDITNENRSQTGRRGPAFEHENFQITTKFPDVHLSAKGIGADISTAYRLGVANVRIKSEDVNILCPQFVLEGKTDFMPNEPETLSSMNDLDLSGAAMTLSSGQIRLKRFSVNGKVQRDKNGARTITATLRFADGDITAAGGDLSLTGAQGTIPLTFPAEKSKQKGGLSISAARYQNLNLGIIQAGLKQTSTGISFSAKLKNHLIPELAATFSGESDLWGKTDYETRARFELLYPQTAPEIDLGILMPAAKGFAFKGKFLEQGNFVFNKTGVRAATESSLSNGRLRHQKNKITVEGIQMVLRIPDLVKMHSAPGQKLKFKRASFGEMMIENGEIDFQIESPRSVLVEKSHFNWCDGKVDAPAIRFTSGIEDYNLILYCDRLDLAKVLQQFGAASVMAEGQLNGRIPLRYQNGKLSFTDGFLFTTPGESGKIRMTDTGILTAGIPPDSPQYVQMELARTALEDYDYKWAKLNLTTEGEDLLLKMQLDGKPAKSLPFVYQKDMGGFAKVEADVRGSTFQGIRLDVNFRLPLNKIMQYKELIQMIQKSRE
ncbi:MAG: YdbH domain-containing protein [Desulfobacterales bacterium]